MIYTDPEVGFRSLSADNAYRGMNMEETPKENMFKALPPAE